MESILLDRSLVEERKIKVRTLLKLRTNEIQQLSTVF